MQRRVPLIRQQGNDDCGPACLAMILAYHGKYVPRGELLHQMRARSKGTTALSLSKVAPIYGLSCSGWNVRPGQIDNAMLPAIAHWHPAHFVVVEAIGDEYLSIIDPAFGRRAMTLKEFGDRFCGTLLTFAGHVSST